LLGLGVQTRCAVAATGLVALFCALTVSASAATSPPAGSPQVSVVVVGAGVVSSADGRISCGALCAAPYRAGQPVELQAAPVVGSSFVGWTGGCFGTAPMCLIAPGRATAVRAVFAPVGGEILATVGGPGVITSRPTGLSCGMTQGDCDVGSFAQGEMVTLTAAPAPGAAFAGWGGACQLAAAAQCTLAVGAGTGVTATFRHQSSAAGAQTLTVLSGGPAVFSEPNLLGPCSSPSPCTASVPSGTSLTLSGPSSWSGDCVGNDSVCALIVDAPTTVSAGFTPRLSASVSATVSVPVSLGGPGRVVAPGLNCSPASGLNQCTGHYRNGSTVVLRAQTTRRRARFVSWGAFCSGRHPTCTLTIGPYENVLAAFRGH
jgi:hypothetical protein